MHVRVASWSACRRVIPAGSRRPLGTPLALVVACASMGSACRRPAVAHDVTIEWKLTPSPPVSGSTTLAELRVSDPSQRPVRGATLRVEGHMSHPGMAPVVATAAERGDGVYEARLQFTMNGQWVLVVDGRLQDGRALRNTTTGLLVVSSSGP
jgi:hypothetical protein